MAKVNKSEKNFNNIIIAQKKDKGICVILREVAQSKILLKRLLIVTANWYSQLLPLNYVWIIRKITNEEHTSIISSVV